MIKRGRQIGGFTFLELMFATVFLGTMVIAASSALGAAATAKTTRASQPLTAMDLAQEIHAATMLLPRSPGNGTPATAGDDVGILEDLDGAVFNPPLDAGLSDIPGMTRWSQEVDLAPLSLANPSNAAAVGADPSETLYALTVTIKQDGVVQGAYTWWLMP